MTYFLEVAPLARLESGKSVLTYSSGQPLAPGTLVRVPLGPREEEGIVVGELQKAPPYPTKPITATLDPQPILDPPRFELARWIASYYYSSLGQALQLFVPRGLGQSRRTRTDPVSQPALPAPLRLSPDQKEAFEVMQQSQATLLYGVTSSGKTELYLQLVRDLLEEGKGAIVLVPEISLTPQTFERFEERFPGRVALWHSHLGEAERIQTWQAIRAGERQVVVGSRSALFLPIRNLGAIIIDEEHDPSYKQESGVRYHARSVAAQLVAKTGAKLILGSATPSLASYAAARKETRPSHIPHPKVALAELPLRVSGKLPAIEIVDLKNELKRGNASTISAELESALRETLARDEQAVLFLGRRGAASSVMCRDCGELVTCPNCSTTLTYHRSRGLVCHHCGHRANLPERCPACGSARIRYFGAGTQVVEEDLKSRFPDAQIIRMDKDTTSRLGSHGRIFDEFRSGAAQILLGTQMVTKGWDIPRVSLVGILLADLSLTLPDFKAAETTYQLLAQVAGRSGRGDHPGRVIIQTYHPEHPVLASVRAHDTHVFYDRELELRQALGYPPFRRLVSLRYGHRDEDQARVKLDQLTHQLRPALTEGTELIGPAPAFIPRLRGKYYYGLVIRANPETDLNPLLDLIPSDVSIDVDPEDLLG